ncbi:MAG: hypothetical protein ACKPKO_32210, partial [Candidatus Fonsibacter sp.]
PWHQPKGTRRNNNNKKKKERDQRRREHGTHGTNKPVLPIEQPRMACAPIREKTEEGQQQNGIQ